MKTPNLPKHILQSTYLWAQVPGHLGFPMQWVNQLNCQCFHPNHSLQRHYLVTQPMLQHQLNRTEIRKMDSYIQISCRFQKCKRKVPPPSPSVMKKKMFFFSKPWGTKGKEMFRTFDTSEGNQSSLELSWDT